MLNLTLDFDSRLGTLDISQKYFCVEVLIGPRFLNEIPDIFHLAIPCDQPHLNVKGLTRFLTLDFVHVDFKKYCSFLRKDCIPIDVDVSSHLFFVFDQKNKGVIRYVIRPINLTTVESLSTLHYDTVKIYAIYELQDQLNFNRVDCVIGVSLHDIEFLIKRDVKSTVASDFRKYLEDDNADRLVYPGQVRCLDYKVKPSEDVLRTIRFTSFLSAINLYKE